MTNLLPCPFCGGEAEWWQQFGWDRQPLGHIAGCSSCGIQTWICDTKDQAIELWNTRAERTCHHVDDGIEWVDEEFCCSECGCTTSLTMSSLTVISDNELHYCPNCGAKVVN